MAARGSGAGMAPRGGGGPPAAAGPSGGAARVRGGDGAGAERKSTGRAGRGSGRGGLATQRVRTRCSGDPAGLGDAGPSTCARGGDRPRCARQLHLRPRTLKVSFSLDNGDCRACTPEGLCTWSEARPGPPIGTGGPGAREELEDRLQPFIWFVLKEVGDGVRCAVSGCLSQ